MSDAMSLPCNSMQFSGVVINNAIVPTSERMPGTVAALPTKTRYPIDFLYPIRFKDLGNGEVDVRDEYHYVMQFRDNYKSSPSPEDIQAFEIEKEDIKTKINSFMYSNYEAEVVVAAIKRNWTKFDKQPPCCFADVLSCIATQEWSQQLMNDLTYLQFGHWTGTVHLEMEQKFLQLYNIEYKNTNDTSTCTRQTPGGSIRERLGKTYNRVIRKIHRAVEVSHQKNILKRLPSHKHNKNYVAYPNSTYILDMGPRPNDRKNKSTSFATGDSCVTTPSAGVQQLYDLLNKGLSPNDFINFAESLKSTRADEEVPQGSTDQAAPEAPQGKIVAVPEVKGNESVSVVTDQTYVGNASKLFSLIVESFSANCRSFSLLTQLSYF